MKRTLLALLVCSFFALPTLAKDGDADFKALVDKYCAGWGSLDPDKAAPLYAKDPDLVFFDVTPLKFTGWPEYAASTREHFATFESLKLTPAGDLKVTQRGTVAWTTSTIHIDLKQKGANEPMGLDVRQTLIWEKRGPEWLIVHEHFSAPMHGDHED